MDSPTTKLLQKPILEPANTLILVTGATGYIGSNLVKEALALGYKVRGTSRSAAKAAETKIQQGNHPNYSTAVISDFAEKGSNELKAAVKDVDAIIMVATDTTLSDNYDDVVDGVIALTKNTLEVAAAEPSIKRFVLTSSSMAAAIPKPGVKFEITTASWSDEALNAARDNKGTKDVDIAGNNFYMLVYTASKVESERALWQFVKDRQPGFVANAILPDTNFGRIVGSPGPTGQMPISMFQKGDLPFVPPQYHIDVVDCARLHLAAAVLDENIANERIFAYAQPWSYNSLMDSIEQARPDIKIKLERIPDEKVDLSIVPNELGKKLLKKWYGQDGYVSLEESIRANLKGIEP